MDPCVTRVSRNLVLTAVNRIKHEQSFHCALLWFISLMVLREYLGFHGISLL